MVSPARRQATYEDLLTVPDHLVAEIVNGEIITHPRPGSPHARAASRLGIKLGPFDAGDDGLGGWVILDEPELHLGRDILVPDLAGWRRARMPEMPDTAAFDLPPDWVCEVLSPSTASTDRADKMPVYARESVRHLWFVDPITRTLEVFRLDGDTFRAVQVWRDDALVRAEPFDALELPLASLWAR